VENKGGCGEYESSRTLKTDRFRPLGAKSPKGEGDEGSDIRRLDPYQYTILVG
jgi:hypothetical protein